MLSAADGLKNITHPLISSMNMRTDLNRNKPAENVLVIETNFPRLPQDTNMFDSYLMDLLLDLKDLKNKAENYIGKFDRVDIRVH
jgi:hypothetical protein